MKNNRGRLSGLMFMFLAALACVGLCACGSPPPTGMTGTNSAEAVADSSDDPSKAADVPGNAAGAHEDLSDTALDQTDSSSADPSAQPTKSPAVPAVTGEQIDETDALIMAHYYIHSNEEGYDFWPEDYAERICVPLYDDDYRIVAYYISFKNGGYAVVNNNRNNPAVLEFGRSDNPQIKALLAADPEAKLIYDNPFSVRTEAISSGSIGAAKKDYYYFTADIAQNNDQLAKLLTDLRSELEERSLSVNELKYIEDPYITNRIFNLSEDGWMTEELRRKDSNDDCSATVAATNLSIIFDRQGYSNAYDGDVMNTFDMISRLTGADSAWDADGVKRYFEKAGGYDLKFDQKSVAEIPQDHLSIDLESAFFKNRPCIISVEKPDGIEWVLAIGNIEMGFGTDVFKRGNFIEVISSETAGDSYYFRCEPNFMVDIYVYHIEDYKDDMGGFIVRLYNEFLNRIPEENEFRQLFSGLFDHTYTVGDALRSVMSTPEYEAQRITNSMFVLDLYMALFGHEPELYEYSNWVRLLEYDYDKDYVIDNMIDLPEFADFCERCGMKR